MNDRIGNSVSRSSRKKKEKKEKKETKGKITGKHARDKCTRERIRSDDEYAL